jgi:hypothetical protein
VSTGWAVALALVIGVLLVARAGRPVTDDDLRRFSTAHRVHLSEAGRREVATSLRRTRVLRTAGGVAGLVASFAPLPPEWVGGGWWMPLTGYLLGAAAAEAAGLRGGGDQPRVAAVVPRTMGRYLPGWTVVALRVLPVAAVLLPWWWGPSATVRLALPAAAAVLVAAGTELLLRAAVRRPRPASSPDLMTAAEALRSSSLHVLSGAGLAIQLALLSAQAAAVGNVPAVRDGRAAVVWWVLSWLLLGLGWGCWRDLTRPAAPAAAPGPA